MYVKNSYGMVIKVDTCTLGEKYFSGTVVSGGTADYPNGYYSDDWIMKKLMGEPLIEVSELTDVFYRDGKLIGVLKCSVG